MSDGEKLFTQADVNRFQAGFRRKLQARVRELEAKVAEYEDRERMREYFKSPRGLLTRCILRGLGVRA